MRLVLASASPRRADLLRAAGFDFIVRSAVVNEAVLPGERPDAYVLRLAHAKAAAVPRGDQDIVLGADTVVVSDGEMLGKPADREEAAAMLRRLSGRSHDVITGVALRGEALVLDGIGRARVTFAPLEPDEIAWYVASGEPFDKAGGYGIQGLASRFVERVEGSYTAVVGLPVDIVHRLLRKGGGLDRR
ncbi:MAG TPA: Maf family protein [Vicinamibacterales bacterium]|nr:Maf family protein [Vicinamibacterales bacterium]